MKDHWTEKDQVEWDRISQSLSDLMKNFRDLADSLNGMKNSITGFVASYTAERLEEFRGEEESEDEEYREEITAYLEELRQGATPLSAGTTVIYLPNGTETAGDPEDADVRGLGARQ